MRRKSRKTSLYLEKNKRKERKGMEENYEKIISPRIVESVFPKYIIPTPKSKLHTK